MRHSFLRVVSSFAFLAIVAITVSGTASAESAWQKMKRMALEQSCKGGDQNACQQLAKLNQQAGQAQSQQQPQQPGQQPQPAGQAQDNRTGTSTPPAGTKIEQALLAPVQQGNQFAISPHGIHAVTLSDSGSRKVMIYDGTPGPVFDQPIQQGVGAGMIGVTFSPDGNRYAYCAQAGDHFIVMLDGKEVGQSSHTNGGNLDCTMFFSPNSKHFFYVSNVNEGEARQGLQYARFIIDGKTELRLFQFDNRNVVFSPDGDHFAMLAPLPPTPQQLAAGTDTTRLIVDGTVAPYIGGSPQWSADSKHLYTTVNVRDGSQMLQLDGKPIMHASRISLTIPPVGDMTVAIVYVRSAGPPPVTDSWFLVVGGKKVAESALVKRGGNGGGPIDAVYISPDGKHYAAICESPTGKQYVFEDGKKGLEYQRIDAAGYGHPDRVVFAADSSTDAYLGFNGSKDFLVLGDQESSGMWGGGSIVTAPVGSHVGTWGSNNTVTLDGKQLGPALGPGQGQVYQLQFTPDGQHNEFVLSAHGANNVYVDGVKQEEGNVANLPGTVIFSPDSKHVAFFCLSSNPAASSDIGLCADGKFTRLALPPIQHLTFTPDGNHLFWTARAPVQGQQQIEVIMDGRPVFGPFFSVTQSGAVIPDEGWQMQPDGTLLLVAQVDGAMKRISITPSSNSSWTSLFGGSMGLSASAMSH